MNLLLLAIITISQMVSAQAMPDPSLTPGDVDPMVNQQNIHYTICVPGWAKKHRAVTAAMKRQAYREYHRVPKKGVCCEVDHLISLELGGVNTLKNLWPEPYTPTPGAHEKDKVENWLHREVCADRMSLESAQRAIVADWYALYQQMMAER